MTDFEPQDELVKKEGFYTRHSITAADTTGKLENELPGDPYNQELIWIWNTYHNVAATKPKKYLYYDEMPLTAKDIKKIYKDVIPK